MTALSLVEANDGWGPTAVPGTATDEDLAVLRDKQEKTPAVTEKERSSSGQLRMAFRAQETFVGRLIYNVTTETWHAWDGQRWAEDVRMLRKQIVIDALGEAWKEGLSDSELRKAAQQCQTAASIDGIVRILESDPEIVVTGEELDAHPHLLNTPGGTVNLETGEVQPHNPADRLTKVTRGSYKPGVVYGGEDVPEWYRFVEQILPDEEVRLYTQVAVGVALFGAVREQLFFVMTGTGANGKSVFVNTIITALGDFGLAADPELFMRSKGDANRASPALLQLKGVRFVAVSETGRGQAMESSVVKQLSGDDVIVARGLYSKPETFRPSHTPFMITNHLPKVDGADPALWRRMRVICFEVVIPPEKRDPELAARLARDPDAVITWLLDGWFHYLRYGMPEAAAVTAATDRYRQDSDTVARFLGEKCVRTPAGRTPLSDLYREFQSWAAEDGAEVMGRREFSTQLEAHGFEKYRSKAGMAFRGVGLMLEESA